MRCHNAAQHSFLSAKNKDAIEFKGLLNLLVLLLLSYNFRAVVESLEERNLVLWDLVKEFWQSGVVLDFKNYQTLIACLLLSVFLAVSFWIEKMAARLTVAGWLIKLMIIVNLTLSLIYPIVAIQWIKSHVLPATYFMMFATANFLKMVSFHHVMSDNRALMRRLKHVTPQQAKDPAFFNIEETSFKLAVQYPNNLRIGHFIRYICIPSFCYQHNYPSTDRIRVFYLLKRLVEACFLLLGTSYLVSQHAQEIVKSSLPFFIEWNWQKIIIKTLHLSVSAAYIWLGNFYLIFHTYCNILAELTYFSDRRFYSDWWNSNDLQEYWSKWNKPIHNFLKRHLYFPLRRLGLPSNLCMLGTFTFSAFFHEYIVIGVFSVVNGLAFSLMMASVPVMMIQRVLKNQISGNTNNLMFWLGYLLIGQPFAILYINYQMHTQTNQLSLQIF